MNIVVNKKENRIIEKTKSNYFVKLNKEDGELYIWGSIHLFKDRVFGTSSLSEIKDLSFNDIIPLFTGQYIAALIKGDTLKYLAVDFYGHMGAYIHEKKESYQITDDISSLCFDEPYDLDKFQIRHFIDKGYCWASGTFIKQLKKISPTITYTFSDGYIQQDFQPFPQYKKNGKLEDCVAETLKAIVKGSGKVGLFFSSGVDSSYIREVARRKGVELIPMLHYMSHPRYFAPEEDYDLAMRINEGSGDIKVCELKDGDSHFASTIDSTVKLLPFDFHPALIQSHIYPIMKEMGINMAISGQNSDSVYALGATHHTPLATTIKQLLTFHIHHSGLKGHFKRYLQTGRFLRRLKNGHPAWWTKYIWNKINPDYEFNFSNLLMAYMKDDAELPIICHDKNDKLEASYINQYQHFVSKLNVLFDRGETPRMVMIRGKLLGHCQGRDVRCLTEWAKKYEMGNIQVFTSGPVLSWIGAHDLGLKDIFVGKRELRKYLDRTIHYTKLKKLVPDYRKIPGVIPSEEMRFHDMYNYINTGGKMDLLFHKACELLHNEGIISDSEYLEYKTNAYSNNSPRLVWFAQSLENLLRNQ